MTKEEIERQMCACDFYVNKFLFDLLTDKTKTDEEEEKLKAEKAHYVSWHLELERKLKLITAKPTV